MSTGKDLPKYFGMKNIIFDVKQDQLYEFWSTLIS